MLATPQDTSLNVRAILGLVRLAIILGVLTFMAISTWMIGRRMRGEIKKTLGRKATDEDLADIDTWIKVDAVEEKAAGKKSPQSQ